MLGNILLQLRGRIKSITINYEQIIDAEATVYFSLEVWARIVINWIIFVSETTTLEQKSK